MKIFINTQKCIKKSLKMHKTHKTIKTISQTPSQDHKVFPFHDPFLSRERDRKNDIKFRDIKDNS